MRTAALCMTLALAWALAPGRGRAGEELPPRGLLLPLKGGPVHSLAFSPDSATLAAGGRGGEAVRLWRLPAGLRPEPSRGAFLPESGAAPAFAPDGKIVAAAPAGGLVITLHDPATGEARGHLVSADESPPSKVSFSPDGRLLVAVRKAAIQLWDVPSRRLTRSFAPGAECRDAAFSPDGKVLCYVAGGKARLWDLAGGREAAAFDGGPGGSAVAFSPDGKRLALACHGGARVWDLATGREVGFFKAAMGLATAVAFSPDGKLLAVGGHGGALKLWDLVVGEVRAELEPVMTDANKSGAGPEPRPGDCTALALSPDGTMLAAGTVDLVRVWGLTRIFERPETRPDNHLARRVLRVPNGNIRAAATTPDGRLVAAVAGQGTVRVFDLATGDELLVTAAERGAADATVDFAPDGKSLALSSAHLIHRWSLPDGRPLPTLETCVPHTTRHLRFTADGKTLFGLQFGELVAWDLGGAEEFARHKLTLGQPADVHLSADGRTLRLLGPEACLVIDTATGQTKEVLRGPGGGRLSGDGRFALTTSNVGRSGTTPLVAWDMAAGREYEPGEVLPSPSLMALAPDRKLAAFAYGDGRVCLYDLAARRQRDCFQAHPGYIPLLEFSPDGRLLLTAGVDQALKVWDVGKIGKGTAAAPPGPDRPAGQAKPPAAEQLAAAGKARDVLKAHCHRCHGEGGAAEGGFNSVLDRQRLVGGNRIAPGSVEQSPLLQRALKGEMPPEGEKARPTETELTTLRKWIEAGAPDWNPAPPRRFISVLDVIRLVRQDRDQRDEEARRHLRYLGVTELYNAGWSDDELQTVRAALAKLLNSLSRRDKIVLPQPLDPERTVFRIDIRDYGWLEWEWGQVEGQHPFGVRVQPDAKSGVETTPVRADWFVHAASRPPLYHVLADTPKTVRELETRLGVDAAANVRQGDVIRAGFNGSGVSRNNRVLERHDAKHGYYWRSYDFAGSAGRQDVFAHPLGPGPGEDTFQHDGGEIIFRLPNGLQGYMLTDARGNRLDRAPANIVSDPKHPERVVENGVSCMSCHARGLIDKADQVRSHVLKNPRAFADAEREAVLKEDAAGFRKAVEATGAKPGVTEPVVVTARGFEAELDLRQAAAELWLTPERLTRLLDDWPSRARSVGVLRAEGGRVQRQAFERAFGGLVPLAKVGEGASGPGPGRPAPLPPRTAAARPGRDFKLAAVRAGVTGVAPVVDAAGGRIAAGLDENTAGVFDAATGKQLVKFRPHARHLTALAISSDGETVATGSYDGAVRLWRVKTGEMTADLVPPAQAGSAVWALAFSADGRLLAGTGRNQGEVRLWDVHAGAEDATFAGATGPVSRLAFSPDGRTLVCAQPWPGGTAVGVCDVQAAKRRGFVGVPEHLESLAVSPDGKTVATTEIDGSVRLFDVQARDGVGGERLKTGDKEPAAARWAAFSPDGKYLATVHEDGALALWDAERLRELIVITAAESGRLRTVAFAGEGKKVAAVESDGTVTFWDVAKLLRAAPP